MRSITTHASEPFEAQIYPKIGLFIGGQSIDDRETWAHASNPSTENLLAPVGGKDSGIGREGGRGSLDAYFVSENVLPSKRRI